MSRYKVPDLWWAVWPYTPPPVCGGRRPTVELRTVNQTRPRRPVDGWWLESGEALQRQPDARDHADDEPDPQPDRG